MKNIIITLAALSLVGCFGPSDEEKQRVETACKEFVIDKLESKYTHEAHVFDTYTKDGKIVVEVGYRYNEDYKWKRDGDSYSVRICVYDEEKGTISIPSVFEMGQWRKND